MLKVRIAASSWQLFSPHPPGDAKSTQAWQSLWPQFASATVRFYVSKPSIFLWLEKGALPVSSSQAGAQVNNNLMNHQNVWVTSEPMFKVRYELEDFQVPKDGLLCISLSPTSQNQKLGRKKVHSFEQDIHGSVSATFSLFKQCVSAAPSPTGYLTISGYSPGQSYLTASLVGNDSSHPIISFSQEVMILFMPGYDESVLNLLERSLLPGKCTS